jgi:hypothetical protein
VGVGPDDPVLGRGCSFRVVDRNVDSLERVTKRMLAPRRLVHFVMHY